MDGDGSGDISVLLLPSLIMTVGMWKPKEASHPTLPSLLLQEGGAASKLILLGL